MRARLKIAAETLRSLEKRRSDCAPKSVTAAEETRLSFGLDTIDRVIEGGLIQNALHEVRCTYARDIGAAKGFIFSLIGQLKHNDTRRISWIIDPASSIDGGKLFPAGLAQYGVDPMRLCFVKSPDLQKAMWAADEAAGCHDLAAMIFQIKGNPSKFDITATRRLLFRARQSGVLCMVLRQSGQEEASAALTRWHIATASSQADTYFHRGIGRVRHTLCLERNRNGQLGKWVIEWNPQTRAFENAASSHTHSIHRLHSSTNRPNRPNEMGKVVAIGKPG